MDSRPSGSQANQDVSRVVTIVPLHVSFEEILITICDDFLHVIATTKDTVEGSCCVTPG